MADATFSGQVASSVRATTVYNAYLSKKFISNLDPLVTMEKFGMQEPIPLNAGRTIEFEKVTRLTVADTPIDEGVPPDSTTPANTRIQADLNEYGDYIEFTNRLKDNAFRNYLVKWAERQRVQMAETRDIIIRNNLLSASNTFYANGAAATDLDQPIHANLLDNAIRNFQGNSVNFITKMIKGIVDGQQQSIPGCYVCFVHPDVVADLQSIKGFIQSQHYSQAPLHPGEVGSYKMIRFISTPQMVPYRSTGLSNVGNDQGASNATSSGMLSESGTQNDVYASILIGADAFTVSKISNESVGIILKKLGSSGAADPLNQKGTMGWCMDFAVGNTQANAIGLLYHCASKLA